VRLPRCSGILLHPTSLPGGYGVGDLGDDAYRFVDLLVAMRQQLWQVLPLGPTAYGDSPYQCFSTFAGNPILISPDRLLAEGLLTPSDLRDQPRFPVDRVSFSEVMAYKRRLFARAADRFAASAQRTEFEAFCHAHASWLDDFALFMALKDAQGGVKWTRWPADLVRREPAALARARRDLAEAVRMWQIIQFFFFRQWQALTAYAHAHGVRLFGDVPIFVADDSADVWAHPELFFLDKQGEPTVVAGVPPDAFSKTGQLWGNPLYRWKAMEAEGFSWWVERIRRTLALVDIVRIDHFIGFVNYWEIKAGQKTAERGRWRPGPGAKILHAFERALGGQLPVVAEDLGLVTTEVEALRNEFKLLGMKVLQFAFGGDADNPYLPHNYAPDCVAYSGTHDNNTTVGWFQSASPSERSHVQRYLARSGEDIAYDFIRAVMESVAETVVVPLQDVLVLGSEARMNVPGRPDGNWAWRFRWEMVNDWHISRMRDLATLYGRHPAAKEPIGGDSPGRGH